MEHLILIETLSTVILDKVINTIPELACGIRVGKIIKDMENEKKKLMSNRDLVQEKVEATDKTERVEDVVFEWLKELEKLIEEEENLKKEIPLPRRNRLLSRVSWALHADCVMRYGMYKEMLKKIKALNAKCEFGPFSSPIPGLEYFSFGNFKCFEPTKLASDQLLEALQDDNCYITGLYGKRGSGKTKLVKAVGEKAKYLKIFDAVLFATVSQSQNDRIRRIQDEIADS